MAYDRQQILRVVNGLLASGVVAAIVAGTITATTSVTAPLVQGQNTAGTGDCQTDYCGVTPDELIIEAPAKVEATVPTVGSLVVEAPAGACISAVTGGTICADANGITAGAGGAGDDIQMTAADDISFGSADISLTASNDVTVSASNDVNLSATAILNASGNGVNVNATAGTLLMYHSTGGAFTADSTGATIAVAGGGGDDITITTAGGDDVIITAGDDFTADGVDTTITATNVATLSGGDVSLTATGDDLLMTALDDWVATITDDITLTATNGPMLLQGATGQLQIDANGGTFNGPASLALKIGGLAYRIAPTLEFDYVNAAPGGTAETLMAELSLPSDALLTTGRGVRFEAHGLAAANANDKTIRIEFGDTGGVTNNPTVATCNVGGATAAAGGYVSVAGMLYRTGSTAQRAYVTCVVGLITITDSAASAVVDVDPTFLGLTVTNPTAAADLTIYAVEWTYL